MVRNHGGVLVSNSPMLREEPLPEPVDGALEVRYSLLVENQSAEPTVLYLSLALSRIADVEDSVQSECRPHYGSKSSDVSLPPLARTRVDCRLRLTALGIPAPGARRRSAHARDPGEPRWHGVRDGLRLSPVRG